MGHLDHEGVQRGVSRSPQVREGWQQGTMWLHKNRDSSRVHAPLANFNHHAERNNSKDHSQVGEASLVAAMDEADEVDTKAVDVHGWKRFQGW